MSSNGYATIEAFDNVISELEHFKTEVQNGSATMCSSGQMIVDGTDGKDINSLKAQKKILLTVQKYQAIIDKASRLQHNLASSRDHIWRLIQDGKNI